MEKAYKFRVYPTREQELLINKTFGSSRYVYNYYLNQKISTYKSCGRTLSYNECSKDLTSLKQALPWLKEVDKCSLQNAIRDLDKAYKNFFNGLKKGQKVGFPKFKSKKTAKLSYRTSRTGNNIEYLGSHIKLPKIGKVRTRDKYTPQGRIISATVSRNPSGKYYVSVCCTDVSVNEFSKTGKSVGIDLGLKDFCVLSNGEVAKNLKFFRKSARKLAKLQRQLSRKEKGSSNRHKAKIKVAKMHEKIANQREDFLQKLSTTIIREYDIICVEDLAVKNMIKNRKLSKSIADVSWSEFVRMLSYKAEWHDKQLVKVGRFYASSQLCSVCGYKNPAVKDLKVREWVCPNCNALHDRDLNASINILNRGLKIVNL